jgi:serine/threonine protein kinase/dipeptidyl aminopeptidase/acylaminoacyl peptidase
MALAPGTLLGQYEVGSPLGAGGMGEVYRAHDTRLGREVAVKILPESLNADADRLRRFEQEARAAAALNHPNILTVYQMATDGAVSYLVSELLDGETLRQPLQRGPLALRKAADYGVQIAHGLAAAHEKGIVHRDLKPENLFVTREGRVKILDFGLARLTRPPGLGDGRTVTLPEGTEPGVVMGTVGYMSPEQARGHVADHRSDLFAFGAILYEMVTGKRAFLKQTSVDTLSAILNEDPVPISQIVPGAPPGLQRLVHRCLEKNPDQRFQSASDLAFALEALSDASGVSISAAAGMQAAKRRGTWPRISLATAVAISLVVAYWWTRPSSVPVVEAITQLTDDGRAKGVHNSLQTDGTRIYFNEGRLGTLELAQVAMTGGPIAMIPAPLLDAQPVGIAPDGSTLLVLPGGAGPPPKAVWQVPLPTGDPIRLGSLEAQDASFTSDGHILLSNLGDLYLTEKDGSNPRKIITGIDGFIGDQSMSPDGQKIVFTRYPARGDPELYEANADGSGVRPIAKASEPGGFCCAKWTVDGRYVVFETRARARQDLWYLPMRRGWLQSAAEPGKLTSGPLSYHDPVPSRDGQQVFALGTRQRGELVRYDLTSKTIVPVLAGLSATEVTYSRNGEWVVYLSFPERAVWRSRNDGADRLQLVAASERVDTAAISPDGTRVAYGARGNIYETGRDGGAPRELVSDGQSGGADWSPDGSALVFVTYVDRDHSRLSLLDLRTGGRTAVPSSSDLRARWIAEDKLVALGSAFKVFDRKTATWSDWEFEPKPRLITRWGVSPDHQYLYYTTGEPDPEVMRVHVGEHKAERIASLKDFPFAMYIQAHGAGREVDVAPDGSPIFTRDTGAQEIYAITVKWP